MIKYFRFSFDYVLWGISWANLNMLLATVPKYEAAKDEKEKVEVIDDISQLANLE